MDIHIEAGLDDVPIGFEPQLLTREGKVKSTRFVVQEERLLHVNVNGIPSVQLGCSPSYLAELVVGWLFSGAIVTGIDEIESIRIQKQPLLAEVRLRKRVPDFSHAFVSKIPTTGATSKELNSYWQRDMPLRKNRRMEWKAEWLFALADLFANDSPAHQATMGAHSCYLALRDQVLYCREDIGRHNAFDKVLGSALIDRIELSECIVFSSGRTPTDMVLKAIRAGIPVLATKAVPTDKTIEAARNYGLTLICCARPDSMLIFNDG